ncbi:(4Fe-4S)-binding protein, partial [Cribrihabitans sp. XS_ASV171]
MTKQVLLCNCEGSQSLDRDGLQEGCGLACSRVHRALCTVEIEAAARVMQGGPVVIACGQEGARFEELAEDLGVEPPLMVDLRDRAGWTETDRGAHPKQAALLAEALMPAPVTPSVDVVSEGTILIVGPGQAAFPLADELCGTLAVTVL